MSSQVLLLNSDYQPFLWSPISTVSWQYAIKQYFTEKIDVVVWYKNFLCRSMNIEMSMPSVIRLYKYQHTAQRLLPVRKNILLRDNFTCQYCMKHFKDAELTLDHVIPKSKGGINSWTNLVTSCKKCNVKKGSQNKMTPNKNPKELYYWEMVSVIKQKKIYIPDGEWQHFLQWPNENVKLYTPMFD